MSTKKDKASKKEKKSKRLSQESAEILDGMLAKGAETGDGLASPPRASGGSKKDAKADKKRREKESKRMGRNATADHRLSPKSSPLLRRLSTFMKQKAGGGKSKFGPSTPDRKSGSANKLKRNGKASKTHAFETKELTQPTWCDVCDAVIWGLFKQCVVCTNCTYTCHRQCIPDVELDCSETARRTMTEDSAQLPSRATSSILTLHPKTAGASATGQGLLSFFEPAEIVSYIDKYNASSTRARMDLLESEDGKSFKGYIRVTLNLTRPIRVATEDAYFALSTTAGSAEGDVEDVPGGQTTRHARSGSSSSLSQYVGDGRAHFYLPKNVSKGLFVTSSTTSQEVISILLKKFKVISNPRKFALYEMNTKDNTRRRLKRFENPLILQLLWGGDNDDFVLSLQEYHDELEFNWGDFSKPELEMFLRFLEAEEAEALTQVNQRFERKEARLKEAIEACTNDSTSESGATVATVAAACDVLEVRDASATASLAIEELSRADASAAIEDL